MPNVISEPSLTAAAAKDNLYGVHASAAPAVPVSRQVFFRNIAITAVLLASAIGGFAQSRQISAAELGDQTDAEAGKFIAAEKPAAAGTNSPDQAQSAAALSKEIANPLSNLWLLQTQQNNTLIGMPLGKGTYVQSDLQFQPLVPVRLSPHWNLISRPVIPIFSSQPFPAVTAINRNGNTNNEDITRTTGFGDMILATAISPDRSLVGNWLLAAGTTFVFPTATQHVLGQQTWQAGPAVALGYQGSKWLAFVFPQHWWKIGGDGKKTNQTSVQYNFNWNFDSGWSLGSSPNLTVNWEAPRDQRVSFPVGFQVGKLLHAGPMPVKVDVQPMYYVVRPMQEAGSPSPKWGFQLQLTPVIPSLIHGFKPS